MPVGYGLGMFQSALNFVADVGQQFIGQEFWEKKSDYMLNQQQELFEYQNDYTAQMNRLARAGLNPNLVYGQLSGGMSMPSASSAPATPSNYHTADVAQIVANLSHAKALDADSNLKNAEAGYWNKMSARYDEIIDWSIRRQQQDIAYLASQINVNESEVLYKNALTLQSAAQKAFIDGEISKQEFQRQNIIAQTQLFKSQSHAQDMQADYMKDEAAIAALEAKYLQLFYSDGHMKELSDAEYKSALNQFNYEAARVAAKTSIEGNKVTQWTDWILGELGQIFGGARDISTAHRNFRKPIK